MSSIRFFKVNLISGAKKWSEVVAAHSGDNAKEYFGDIVFDSEFLGFNKVIPSYNGVEITFEGGGIRFDSESICYSYLYNHFQSTINKMLSELREQGLYQ